MNPKAPMSAMPAYLARRKMTAKPTPTKGRERHDQARRSPNHLSRARADALDD
jgi:hypothetical protein